MTNAEHLIENAIYAEYQDKDLDKVLDEPHNKIMLEETGIQKDDIIRMAYHVIYSLYDGINPFSQEWETGRQIAHTTWDNPREGEYEFTWDDTINNLERKTHILSDIECLAIEGMYAND